MASSGQALTPAGTVEVDYRSADGPEVTHVRGGVLAASLAVLKSTNQYDRYVAHLQPELLEQITYAIAASWIPVEVAMAHCSALDALGFSETVMVQQGERVGSHWGALLYSALLKATRSLGGDVAWLALRQSGRLMQRVYRGGGCTVIRVGPKDALYELHGLSLVRSPYFRATHQASMRAIARLMAERVFVRPARPREPHPHRIATSYSWV